MPNCAHRPPARRHRFATHHGAVAILAASGLAAVSCADDGGVTTSGSGGGSTGTSAIGSTTGTSTSAGSPTSTGAGGGSPTSTSSGEGGNGQGGNGQGGNGQGGNGQGGNGQGGSGQGGNGQGGNGQGGNGQGGNGQGGNGQGGSGQGGSGGFGPGGTGGAGGGQGGAGGSGPCVDDAGCDDGVACTTDTCDLDTGACTNLTDDAACDDGSTCTGVEICTATGCEPGTPLDCDDGIDCTADFCDLGSDTCASVPQDVSCTDGLFCNGSEQCDVVLGCIAGTPPACDDGLGCTADACDEGADTCAFVPNDGACADADLCDGAEVCDPDVGCVEGAPLVCDDGIACTFDTCEAATGCLFTTNDAACDDGSDCNGVDRCDDQVGCVDGTPVVCPGDGVACTIETCSEADLSCSSTPSNGACPGGQFCVPQQGGCVVGTPCDDPSDCIDPDPCNGIEQCVAGTCAPGVPVICDDGIDCTFEQCDPGTGQCEFFPQDEECEDGNACNGVATCAIGQGCVAGAPVVCDDGVDCTFDVCNPVSGACSFPGDDTSCDDGEPCNGAEQCGANGCAAGPPVVCADDGIACTEEACVPGLGCRSTPDDSLCPCTETCSVEQGGCGNFCQIAECQGKVYECGDCLDNDGDCRVDAGDTQCLGACDNTEDSFFGGIPGQNNSPCKSDCYFDQDTGAGNDDCYWSHECDPLSVAPNFPPEGSQCEYDPGAGIPGYPGNDDCTNAFDSQSAECGSYCGPLTPNGCDCFGCCAIPGAPTTVWLGSTENNQGSCTLDDLDDPARCEPCTQVPACLNTCENCEICVGKPELPPECTEQVCPGGAEACGQPGQPSCPAGDYCVTGCCQPLAD